MTAIELQQKERELIQEINNDANLLESALKYVKRKKRELKSIKCQFSMDKLEDELQLSEQDIKSGNTYTQAEMRKLHPEWK